MLSPFWMQTNDCITTLIGIYFVGLAQTISNKLGKVSCLLIMDFTGVSLFFTVIYVFDN